MKTGSRNEICNVIFFDILPSLNIILLELELRILILSSFLKGIPIELTEDRGNGGGKSEIERENKLKQFKF